MQKHLVVVLPIHRHAEPAGVEILRTPHVLDMQHDVADPARLDHLFLLRSPFCSPCVRPAGGSSLTECRRQGSPSSAIGVAPATKLAARCWLVGGTESGTDAMSLLTATTVA